MQRSHLWSGSLQTSDILGHPPTCARPSFWEMMPLSSFRIYNSLKKHPTSGLSNRLLSSKCKHKGPKCEAWSRGCLSLGPLGFTGSFLALKLPSQVWDQKGCGSGQWLWGIFRLEAPGLVTRNPQPIHPTLQCSPFKVESSRANENRICHVLTFLRQSDRSRACYWTASVWPEM